MYLTLNEDLCCYLGGALLGIIVFLLLLKRDGVQGTAIYWLNPPSFMGPFEHFGSFAALNYKLQHPQPVSVPKTILALSFALFSSVVTCTLFGGFLLMFPAFVIKAAFKG